MKLEKNHVTVQYQDYPRGEAQCDRCRMYVPGGNCTAVLGPIINTGWCRLFKRDITLRQVQAFGSSDGEDRNG